MPNKKGAQAPFLFTFIFTYLLLYSSRTQVCVRPNSGAPT
jgi:hypothetical protein